MSETTIDVDQAGEETSEPQQVEEHEAAEPATETIDDVRAKLARYKEIAKTQEKRAKENADKAKRFDELEEANKTELQKLLDRAEKAEKAAAEAQIEKMRSDVARETGVPAQLIHGATEEEMRAAAEIALAFKGNAKPSPAAPAKLVTANGDSTKSKQITSRDELKSMTPAQILAAQKEGRLDELMGKST